MAALSEDGVRAIAVCIRNVTLVVFAFLFGLRESSIFNMHAGDVRYLYNGSMDILVPNIKVRTRKNSIRRGPRIYSVPGDKKDDNPFSGVRRFPECSWTASYLFFLLRSHCRDL